jgi:acyl dehydratase
MSRRPEAQSFDSLVDGQVATDVFQIGDQDMEAFAELSGDRNPLHFDPDAAATQGFEGPVVFGGLIIARLSQLIGMQLPGPGSVWTNLQVSFHGPLYAGQTAKLVAQVAALSPATRSVQLKFRLTKGDDELVAKGKLGVYLGHAR